MRIKRITFDVCLDIITRSLHQINYIIKKSFTKDEVLKLLLTNMDYNANWLMYNDIIEILYYKTGDIPDAINKLLEFADLLDSVLQERIRTSGISKSQLSILTDYVIKTMTDKNIFTPFTEDEIFELGIDCEAFKMLLTRGNKSRYILKTITSEFPIFLSKYCDELLEIVKHTDTMYCSTYQDWSVKWINKALTLKIPAMWAYIHNNDIKCYPWHTIGQLSLLISISQYSMIVCNTTSLCFGNIGIILLS